MKNLTRVSVLAISFVTGGRCNWSRTQPAGPSIETGPSASIYRPGSGRYEESHRQVPEHHHHNRSASIRLHAIRGGWSGEYRFMVIAKGGDTIFATKTVLLSNAVKDVCRFLNSKT